MKVKDVKELVEKVDESLPETVKETDGVLSTIIGYVNHVVFFRVKKSIIKYKYKLEEFSKDLENKSRKIPDENIQEPKLSIFGPTIEGLKYTIDDADLREMFLNLLTSSMDNRKDAVVHPSYVEIIKQMNSDEARLLKHIAKGQAYPLIDVVTENNKDHSYVEILKNFTNIAEGVCLYPNNIFAYIENLLRLGIIEIPPIVHLKDDSLYHSLENHIEILEIKKQYENQEQKIVCKRKLFRITSFGQNFINSCVI